mmetsp:Transcript_1634/g.4140  ORF Transcript_1634/g.4140 Transcript_1634/m.4140 type:complete len:290 (+) Transcript_1634:30-899(+)
MRVQVSLNVVGDDGAPLVDAGSASDAGGSGEPELIRAEEQPGTSEGAAKLQADCSQLALKQPLNVLVVEDSEMQRAILQNLFDAATRKHQEQGSSIAFRVTLAKNAKEALQIASQRPDIKLVLLDILMPDQNGDELLPRLRHIVGDQTAVVTISSANQVDLVERCIVRGADSFVPKPLQLGVVWAIWQYCLLKSPQCFYTSLWADEPISDVPRGGMARPQTMALGRQQIRGDGETYLLSDPSSTVAVSALTERAPFELPEDFLGIPPAEHLPAELKAEQDEQDSVCQQQ